MGKEAEGRFVVVHCRGCGGRFRTQDWKEGSPCPKCASTNVNPAIVTGGAVDYALADRSGGHAIEDIRFGQLARWAGVITSAQYQRAMAVQRRCIAEEKPVPPIGDVLIELGAMSEGAAHAILEVASESRPSTSDEDFARRVAMRDWLDKDRLERLKDEQRTMAASRHEVPSLAQLAFEKRLLSEDQVLEILKLQLRDDCGLLAELRLTLGNRRKTVSMRSVVGVKGISRRDMVKTSGLLLIPAAVAFVWYRNLAGGKNTVCVMCDGCKQVSEITWNAQGDFPVTCPKCRKPMAQYCVKCLSCRRMYTRPHRFSRKPCPFCGSPRATEKVFSK
ncbi:MAG TPA: hypothetical protein PL033_15595 [Candidatus Brocadiia bacterium]|nr:hypothetical protein [Candidatus Brocadiia bacterium]